MSRRSLPNLSRIALVAAIAVVGAALVAIVWVTQRSVVDARATMLKGLVAEAGAQIQRAMVETDGPPAAKVAAAFDATSDAGVRYIAVIEAGQVVAEAGQGSTSAAALVRWFATAPPDVPVELGDRVRVALRRAPGRRPGRRGPPALTRRGPPELILELGTDGVDDLDAAATWSLGIGIAAAVTLLGLTIVLVRWSLGRAANVRAVEQARHLANLGQMSAVLAHEIRNPLASLKGNAQLLARGLPEGDRSRARADRVVDEALRLEHLTNDLLAFARSGEITIGDADPTALVRDAAAAVAPDRITIDATAAPRTWPLDAERVRQVLVNLLENAAEMSESPIEATIAGTGATLTFDIRDHGPGLPEGEHDRLFEPFFTKRIRGTGLGLAVCKRLVELHGGTISAANAEGGGARFRIVLPRGGRR
ncbi:MAG: HAMP domain-containing sensor histidine kinase [Kofleriaceae bacterium]